MYKIFGAVMIFSACSLVGVGASRVYVIRVRQLEAFLRLISHIKGQIECFCAPLENIFADYDDRELSGCGFLFAARQLGAKGGFESCRERLLLTDNESDELMRFFSELGKNSADEESRSCAYYEKTIGEALSSERSELGKRSKLCRTFGMLIGFLLSVLLI